jgi:hypothetical protein
MISVLENDGLYSNLELAIVTIGTLWYGWTLQFKTAWVVPIVGSGVAGLGITTVQVSAIPLYLEE